TLIQDVILNDENDMENKKIACQLLDALYSEGIKLPINFKDKIIKMFSDKSKSDDDDSDDDDDDKQYALISLSLIAVNQDNHKAIISEGIIEITCEYIRKVVRRFKFNYYVVRNSMHLLINLIIFGETVIEYLKFKSYELLALIAECQDNHDAILKEKFENKIFECECQTLDDLQLTYNLLKFGTNVNQKKVALAVKEKVERLLIDEYVNELKRNHYWINKDQLASQAKEIIEQIRTIEEAMEQEGEFEEINTQMIQNKGKDDENQIDIIWNYDFEQVEEEDEQEENNDVIQDQDNDQSYPDE
ncbi:MAG: hypothetical protein EZS28_005296, partial [Streblomastix strix]